MKCPECSKEMFDPIVMMSDETSSRVPLSVRYRCDPCKCWWSFLTKFNEGYGKGEEVGRFNDDGTYYNYLPFSTKKNKPPCK